MSLNQEAITAFYTDIYTVMVITSKGEGKKFRAGNLEFANTIAKRYPVAMVACNGVQLCVWANGVLVQGGKA